MDGKGALGGDRVNLKLIIQRMDRCQQWLQLLQDCLPLELPNPLNKPLALQLKWDGSEACQGGLSSWVCSQDVSDHLADLLVGIQWNQLHFRVSQRKNPKHLISKSLANQGDPFEVEHHGAELLKTHDQPLGLGP